MFKHPLNRSLYCLKTLSLLVSGCLISAHSLAMTVTQPLHLNTVQTWQLSNPSPDHVTISTEDKKRTIVIHVDQYRKSNNNLPSDTIEFICGDTHLFFKAGATGSCTLSNNVAASFSIKTDSFRHGAEGSLTYIE